MKKILTNVLITAIIGIVVYFASTRIFFKVPSPTGIGYADITYKMGYYVSGISSIISFILLCVLNRNKK